MVPEPLAAQVAVDTAPPSQLGDAKRARRRTWYYELAVILVGYWLYSLVRNAVTAEEGDAVGHARDVVRLERDLGLFHEHALNSFVASQHWLAYACNYYYATMHFAVTIGVGVWLYRRHPLHARQLRTAWYLTNIVALFGFAFFPLAPPRLLPGGHFVDTVVAFHTWGSWGDQSVSSHSNLYAAMPSMHIGWSLWVAVCVVYLARRTWVRVLGAAYPLCTLFVIIGTGNHYWIDALGGVAALLGGLLLSRLISRGHILPPLSRSSVRAEELGDQGHDDVGPFLERPVADAGERDHADRRRVDGPAQV